MLDDWFRLVHYFLLASVWACGMIPMDTISWLGEETTIIFECFGLVKKWDDYATSS